MAYATESKKGNAVLNAGIARIPEGDEGPRGARLKRVTTAGFSNEGRLPAAKGRRRCQTGAVGANHKNSAWASIRDSPFCRLIQLVRAQGKQPDPGELPGKSQTSNGLREHNRQALAKAN